jgi:hypothetical protein
LREFLVVPKVRKAEVAWSENGKIFVETVDDGIGLEGGGNFVGFRLSDAEALRPQRLIVFECEADRIVQIELHGWFGSGLRRSLSASDIRDKGQCEQKCG